MKKDFLLSIIFFLAITLLFFYPIFKGHIPFPGDLLAGNYEPYKSRSNLGYAPGGIPNKAQGPDVIRELFPWKYFTITSIKSGQIPFWTPYNFSGNPIMANFQSAVFYPLNVIFFLLPFLLGWTVFILLSPFLTGLFSYFFLRELKLSHLASIFGGIVFAFSSYMVVWMEYGNITHTLMWLPLVLFFTEKYLQNQSRKNILFLILSLWFSFLAGYIQGFFYIFVVTFIYFIVKISFSEKKKLVKKIVFLIVITSPILLSLFQLLPTLELYKISSRSNYSLAQITNLLNPWWYSITVFVPDFFGNPATRNFWFPGTYIERVSFFGVIPLLMALIAIFSPKTREIKIFSWIFVITFILSLDLIFTRYFYLLPIPVLSTTVPTRVLSLFVFCGAILSAYGFNLFLQNKQKKRFIIASIVIILFLISIWSYVFTFSKENVNLLVSKRNLILPTFFSCIFLIAVLIRFSNITKKIPYFLALIVLALFSTTIFDLFYFFHKITPFSPREFIYPQTEVINFIKNNAGVYRYWGYGPAYIDSNFQTVDKTFSPEGNDPLHIVSYTEFLEASKDGKLPKNLPRPDANIAPGFGQDDLRTNHLRQKVLNVLGVRYILHKNETIVNNKYQPDTATFDPEIYKLVWQKTPWQIYENKQVLPRVFLAFNYETLDKNNIIKKFFDKNFNPRKTILLEERLPMTLDYDEHASVVIKKYEPNMIVLGTNAKTNALLFLSDNYYPDWSVTIDGKHAKVYKADYTFRAVPVEKGKHDVIFSYNPKSFYFGIILSFLAFFILLLNIIVFNKRKILK